MDWKSVESSNVDAIATDGGDFFVRFKGGTVYKYENVTPEMVDQIAAAESVGKTFNSLVKSKPDLYPFTRLG